MNILDKPSFIKSAGAGSTKSRRKHGKQDYFDIAVLKELERLRTELMANLSLELHNPLTSIKSITSTLLQMDIQWSEKERREVIESINQETERLSQIIEGLLQVNQLGNEGLVLEKVECQVSDIIGAIADQLDVVTRHHRLQIKMPAHLPKVFVDKRRIGQVILKLVQNAVKYSKEGSPVVVEAKHSRDQVIICVSDQGVGIPAQLVDKVFDRFYQVENIVGGHRTGISDGLSICREIIEAHGCKIWVESKIGEGSQFSFTLPQNLA